MLQEDDHMKDNSIKESSFLNEEIIFIDEEEGKFDECGEKWKLMIVDDDTLVHKITKMVLKDFEYKGKSLEFISAYSGKEAKEILARERDIAIILLDVVMEEDEAGLKLVEYIRTVIKNHSSRIILRTGQPGKAPEKQVILDYDIDDYKEKTELTAQKLFTTIVAALRTYQHITLIEKNRKSLEKIIEASPSIFELKSLGAFVSSILDQMISILNLGDNTLYYNTNGFVATRDYNSDDFYIVVGSGRYKNVENQHLNKVVDDKAFQYIEKALAIKKSMYFDKKYIAFFKSKNGVENIIFTETSKRLDKIDIELLEMFCNNVSIAFDNLYLNQEIEETQKEIIYTLGEVTEARSKEVGNHVKRVASYSEILARGYGLDEEEIKIIKMAVPIHDIGKIAIPDSILNKPSKLTTEEYELVKTHTTIGYTMLKNSSRKILQAAATIAYQHQEKFDGTGYPRGLKGEEIHIYGRIAAISDVFDALGSDRVYKKAWTLDKILQYFKAERGKQFDPKLVDIMFDNLDDFIEIRDRFSDNS